MSKIQQSADYRKFIINEFNRDVVKTKHLEQSMKKHGWIDAYPAHVHVEGGLYKIKAGHHRVTVAKKLGIPIKFVVCRDDASIHELEQATVAWKPVDYVISNSRIGNPHYIELDKFSQRTGISRNLAASMLHGECAGSGNASVKIKNGTFVINNMAHAEEVAELIAFLTQHKVEFAILKNMVIAISQMLMVPEFDKKTFKKKVESHAYTMKKPRSLHDALESIEDVYNRKSGLKIPLAFRAEELARERKSRYIKQKEVVK